jgi:hypothetical protein
MTDPAVIERALAILGLVLVAVLVGRAVAWFLRETWIALRHCNERYMFHCWHFTSIVQATPAGRRGCRALVSVSRQRFECCRCKRAKLMVDQ